VSRERIDNRESFLQQFNARCKVSNLFIWRGKVIEKGTSQWLQERTRKSTDCDGSMHIFYDDRFVIMRTFTESGSDIDYI
jgi:hypothetical protein